MRRPDTSKAVLGKQVILIQLMLSFSIFCQAEQPSYSVEKWVDKLSVKSDPLMHNWITVTNEILALDTTDQRRAIHEMELRCQKANPRCRIRFSFTKNEISKANPSFAWVTWSLEKTKQMLQLAYEIEDPYLIAFGNKVIANDYWVLGDFGMAVMHTRIAIENMEVLYPDQPTENTFDYYTLGENLYHTREYKAAIESFHIALASLGNPSLLPFDTIENRGILLYLYNTMGLSYQKLHQYDSALIAFDHALKLARTYPNHPWVTLIQGNRGDVFFMQGRYDSAKVLLALDVEGSLAQGPGWADNAANSMQWLARIKTIEGDPKGALEILRASDLQLKKLPKARIQANIYYGFIEAFRKLGNADSVFIYMQKYQHLHDSLEYAAGSAKAEVVQMRLENEANIHRITSLNKEKRRISLIRNFIIVFVLLLSFIGFMVLNRQKLKLKVKQQQALDEKRIAEQEAQSANDQLKLYTRNLIEKNTLVETLQQQLLQKEISEEQKVHIASLSAHAILTDEDWENFKNLFEKVYPAFFYRLRQKVSDLSMADLRIAAMSKLQLSNKEAATLLGIAPNSVLKGRQRLRHRLGLEPETDLEHYFAHSPDF